MSEVSLTFPALGDIAACNELIVVIRLTSIGSPRYTEVPLNAIELNVNDKDVDRAQPAQAPKARQRAPR